MRSPLIALTLLLVTSTPAISDCTMNSFGFCQENWDTPGAKEWQKFIDGARETGSKIRPMDAIKVAFPSAQIMIEAVGKSGIPVLNSAAQNIAAIGTKLDKETQTAITNALNSPNKAIQDAARTALKAAADTVEAAEATGRFAERTISGNIEILNDAESRLREGKVVDAVWHLSTDRMRLENDNAAKLMEESEVAREVAEKAVALNGGPAASAAFAAWLTYNSSKGDIEKALLAGTYAYVVSSGNSAVKKMPTGTVDEAVKKAATVAAVRGLAVGAAGGSQEEILNAIAQSGGSVIVQSGKSYVTKAFVNPARAKADVFCMDQVNETCVDAMQYVDDAKQKLEQYRKSANSSPTVVVSTDGQWAISWNKETLVNRTSKTPGVVLTYIGQGSYYRQQMINFRDIAIGKLVTNGGQTDVVNRPPPPPPPPPIKYHEITIASNGLWIDDMLFPMSGSSTNNIEFYIDGEYEGQTYLNRGLDSITKELAEGDHVLTYKVNVRSSEGGRIRQECATKFKVSGVDIFNPSIQFVRIDQMRGRISKCELLLQ
jgi:urease accessory protein UreF